MIVAVVVDGGGCCCCCIPCCSALFSIIIFSGLFWGEGWMSKVLLVTVFLVSCNHCLFSGRTSSEPSCMKPVFIIFSSLLETSLTIHVWGIVGNSCEFR